MVNYKQFYTNNKPVSGKTKCCEEEVHNAINCDAVIPKRAGEFLKTNNYLSEYSYSDADRERVLNNLGINTTLNEQYTTLINKIDSSLQTKIGYVYEDKDEGNFLGFENEEKCNQYYDGGKQDESLVIVRWNNGMERGLPIYTKSYADKFPEMNPEDYIVIPDETDLTTSAPEVTDKTYDTSINGPLANILFSAIRQLQSEIAKIKNSFNYGIYSYTGTNTAMSRVVGEYSSLENGREEEEPLWAVEEDGLSIVSEVQIGPNSGLSNEQDINSETEGVLYIGQLGSSWNLNDISKGITDPKVMLYTTTSNLNISYNLKNNDTNLRIDLQSINIGRELYDGLYNVLLIISRKVEVQGYDRGKNFIWVSIKNGETDRIILEGYYDLISNTLTSSIYELDYKFDLDRVNFIDTRLSRCALYSKYQDFTQNIISSTPSEEDYRYRAAHITIRSVGTYSTLDFIKDQLPENELIFVEDTKQLYIKNNFSLIVIGTGEEGNHNTNNGMSWEEILLKLEQMGIKSDSNGHIEFSDITFIHEDSGTKFKLHIDSEGNLVTTEINNIQLLDMIREKFGDLTTISGEKSRGFIGRLGEKYFVEKNPGATVNDTVVQQDIKLYSDRLKIGSFYAPASTNKTFGCSHCFIELENTWNYPIPLSGCYLYYAIKEGNNNTIIKSLELTGTIPAGGTYLIRGAKKAEFDDPNTFIKVKTFDQEWWDNSELVDFSGSGNLTNEFDEETGEITSTYPSSKQGFLLTYGDQRNNLKSGQHDITEKRIWYEQWKNDKEFYTYEPYYIDSICFNGGFIVQGVNTWIIGKSNSTYNSKDGVIMNGYIKNSFQDILYKNTFELDPAKQAYQSLTGYDSSRYRHQTDNDYQYVFLDKEFIEFPHSDDKYPVSKFTPKASFEHKNVCTDKTQLDIEKPNMVTCSFGKNPYTTRCFNWISGGLFDEYVWIKDLSDNTIWHRFESYKEGDEFKSQEPGDLKRKEFKNNADIINCVYKRITGRFPAANTQYTAHKCIINIVQTAVQSPTEYTYIVGRADKNGNPDFEHCSEEYTFTLYPTSYIPRIYQITDQQGFHWIEYQAWAAAAKVINEQINNETSQENIIPILVNTGDMTQSGARINEWLDYYNAGKCLFNHLEQMNVVGNNDLCGTDPEILGTGDDEGKSNAYYFHIFYCYEIETDSGSVPIITGLDSEQTKRYVPSLYKIEFNDLILLFVNSEITSNTCKNWYKLSRIVGSGAERKEVITNAYTGWDILAEGGEYYSKNRFTTIYEMLYNMTEGLGNKKLIAACHEMPFTVITFENLKINNSNTISMTDYRSLSRDGNNKLSLVGSHLNQIDKNDKMSTHWFSRLLEFRGCKLCIGGHKHTFAITYQLRENYLYYKNITQQQAEAINYKHRNDTNWIDLTEGRNLVSSIDFGPMTMNSDLENDNDVVWTKKINGINMNLSKFPITKSDIPSSDNNVNYYTGNSYFHPAYFDNNLDGGIIYFMCQATGFKLMSNKELPGNEQAFSQFIPKSKQNKNTADTAQRYPMYAVIQYNNEDLDIYLVRLRNIQSASNKLLSQVNYTKNQITKEYLYDNKTIDQGDVGNLGNNYDSDQDWKHGGWTTTKKKIISIDYEA